MNNNDLVKAAETNKFFLRAKAPRSEQVLRAMSRVDRADFADVEGETYTDQPIDLIHGQTCSQPSMVAFICDVLNLQRGMNVLEIGTGCGYHAAITAEILGKEGKLTSIELLEDLAGFANYSLRQHFGDNRVTVFHGDGSNGYPQGGPYNAIYLTAETTSDFDERTLANQLVNGWAVIAFPAPGKVLWQTYYNRVKILEDRLEGTEFVPLIGANGHPITQKILLQDRDLPIKFFR